MQTHQETKKNGPGRIITLTRAQSAPPTLEINLDNVFVTCALLRQLISDDLKRGYSITMIAAASGLCSSTVRRIGDGATREPRMSTVLQILRHFGYSVTARRELK